MLERNKLSQIFIMLQRFGLPENVGNDVATSRGRMMGYPKWMTDETKPEEDFFLNANDERTGW